MAKKTATKQQSPETHPTVLTIKGTRRMEGMV